MKYLVCLGVYFIMISELRRTMPDGGSLLRAAAAWMLSAPVFLALAALAANVTGAGERSIGYISSAVSFLSAAAAGYNAMRNQKSAGIAAALITATAIVIMLLSVGFLIKGEEMNASSMISLVSFTYAGILVGAIGIPKKEKSYGKRRRTRKLT
jgi:putative membrane protein (TIGR04086 family)